MNDADHEEFVSMHVISKNLQSIRSDKRLEDLISEIVLCNFDLMCLQECWRVDAEECFETERGDLIYLSGGDLYKGVGVVVSASFRKKKSNKLVSMPTIPVFQFQAESRVFHANKWILCDKGVSILHRLRYFEKTISPVACFGASHRAIHKDDLAKLDVEYRRLLRIVVGPPTDTNWASPWHEILHLGLSHA